MVLRRSLLLLVLLALAVLMAVWSFTQSAPTLAVVERDEPKVAAAAEASTPNERDAAQRTPVVEASPLEPSATARLRVDVVLPSGQPAVGARVRVGEQEAECDAQGSAEFVAARGAEVSATLGALYGEGEWLEDWSGDRERVLVELATDVHAIVEVVDPLGVPQQGVRVLLNAEIATRHGELSQPEWRLETDARGHAELEHLQCEDAFAGSLAARVRVRVAARDDEDAQPWFEAWYEWEDVARAMPIRVVAPASGTIVVRATDADGTAMHYEAVLESQGGEVLIAATEGDDEVFRSVPLGVTWSLKWRGGETVQQVRGPERANEVVRVDVPLATHSFVLRGTVRCRDGMQFTEGLYMAITARLPQHPEEELPEWRIPMAEPFEIPLALEMADLAQIEIHVDPAPNSLCQAQTFVITRAMKAGEVDVGDLVLEPEAGLEELATFEARLDGRIVTHDVPVRLLQGLGTNRSMPPFLRQRRGDVAVLLGKPLHQVARLECWRDGCLTLDPLELRRGELHRVELQRAASLRIDLRQAGVHEQSIVAELLAEGEAEGDGIPASVQASSLAWREVVPGTYSLRIRCGDQTLLHEPKLVLGAGPQRWPADGRAVDVRCARVIRVVARSGGPTRALLYPEVLAITADTRPEDELDWTDGWFVPERATTAVLVRSPGHVPVRIPVPQGDVVLTLQPMIEVQMQGERQVHVRIVTDGLVDPLLRAFDRDHEHRATSHCPSDAKLYFAPGTVLECTPVGGGEPGPTRRVEVGREAIVVDLH